MKIRANKRLFLYIIVAVLIGLSDAYKVAFYALYFPLAIIDVISFSKSKNNRYLLNICMYSVISPDNYLSIISIALCVFLSGRYKRKFDIYEKLLIGWVIIRGLLSILHPLNLAFSLLYWSAFLVCYLWGEKLLSGFDKNEVIKIIKNIIVIELITIAIRAVFFGGFSNLDLDWVYGTLGQENGVQLFIIMALCSMLLIQNYYLQRRKTDLIWGIIAMLIAVMTGSIAVTLLFIMAFAVYTILYANIKRKIVGIVGVIAIFALLIFFNQAWVSFDIINLTNISYFTNRVQKVEVYVNTFSVIPQENVGISFVGEGIGRYSSRAAITMSGDYIDAIQWIDMSEYTEKYIYPLFYKSKVQNIGTASMPFSEICTIAGELGFIGLFLFIMVFLSKYRKSDKFQKMLLLVVIFILLFDNYMEFPRVSFAILLMYHQLTELGKSKRVAVSKKN